mmetsp:Transcript_53189/g.84604  ORF Transcript_53189/g.84604 Transcript_53189/m.84604 type:complete len:428 (+) Transcript_53189:43-1326(+)
MERTLSNGSAPVNSTAVQVVASTWARDSHDLFDFEAHQLHTKTFTVQKSMKCVRSGHDVQMIPDHQETVAGADPLLRLVNRDGNFWVDKATPSSTSKKLWLVVRDLATCGHKLTESDVIKLGRFKFRVRQLVASSTGQQPELRLDDAGTVCHVDSSQNANLATTMCRICLLEGPGEDGNDPLITPCECKGSIEYVHLGCLRHWIRGRLNFPETSMGSYFYRPLSCELCKATYPTQIMSDRERMPLVEVPQTQAPFVVLENMVRDSQQHTSRGLHVISLAEKALKLGRGHESDVRIADVSISRCHATISFVRGQFVLEDNNSKFGTLVAMKKPRQLDANSPTSIQMGRTVLSLSLQAPPDQVNSTPSLNQLPGSNAQDERNLRLSLLTRTSRGDNSMNASEWMRGGDQSSVDGDPLVDGSLRDHEATL